MAEARHHYAPLPFFADSPPWFRWENWDWGEKGLTEPYKQSRGSHLTVSLPLGKNSVTTHLNDSNNDDNHDGISECRIGQGL